MSNHDIDRQAIISRALRHGFTLREQPGGEMGLNDHVYAFAREVFEAGRLAGASESGRPTSPCQGHARQQEADELRARVAELEAERDELAKQEPVAWIYDWQTPEGLIRDWTTSNQEEIPEQAINIRPLYARPVLHAEQPVNARLLEALKAAKVALQKVVEDCGGCEHEAGVCVCPELAAISQSVEAIAAAESQHAGPVRLTETQVIEIGGFQGGAAPGYVTELCPDCAGAQHERQPITWTPEQKEDLRQAIDEGLAKPAIGLMACNSQLSEDWTDGACAYVLRTTDPGCTGCVERDEDQRAEAGG